MIKKFSLNNLKTAILMSLAVSMNSYAADFNSASAVSPAQIVIQNALVKTASGNQYMTIQLIARDGKNLHPNQNYQANFMQSSGGATDGVYDQASQSIYIEHLQQAGSMVHQVTLRQTSNTEFTIVSLVTAVLETPNRNVFFDPSLVHRVEIDRNNPQKQPPAPPRLEP